MIQHEVEKELLKEAKRKMNNRDTYKLTSEFFLKSVAGGVLIGFGCIAFMMCDNKVVGSFLFSLGLLTVIITQSNLYTGKIGYAKAELRHWFLFLLPVLLINLLSIGIIGVLFGNFSDLPIDTSALLANKYNESMMAALLRSFGCGVMMFIAVEGYKRISNPLIVIMPVMCFILCGFDHCIANYGYMAMNNDFFCPQLIMWIIGNSIGSIILKFLTFNNVVSNSKDDG